MKKRFVMLLVLLLAALLSGCCLNHQWQEADCTHAQTCINCAKTEGEALDHTWLAPDCVTARTCSRCGETQGEALGHTWVEATCLERETCSVCGKAKGWLGRHTIFEGALTENEEDLVLHQGKCILCEAEDACNTYEDWKDFAVSYMVGRWECQRVHDGVKGRKLRPDEREISYAFFKESRTGTIVNHGWESPGGWDFAAYWPVSEMTPEACVVCAFVTNAGSLAQMEILAADTSYMTLKDSVNTYVYYPQAYADYLNPDA